VATQAIDFRRQKVIRKELNTTWLYQRAYQLIRQRAIVVHENCPKV